MNLFSKIAFVFYSAFFVTGVYAQVSPIACYPMDGNANDLSGNANHGVMVNVDGATNKFGQPNKALNFSGQNSSIAIEPDFFKLNTYTISLWCKLGNLPMNGQYFSLFSIGGTQADQSVLIGYNDSWQHIGFGFGSYDTQSNPHHCYSGTLPEANQWYHVMVSRNNDSLALFVDGQLICTTNTNGDAGYAGSQVSFTIGSRVESNFQNFEGIIDDFKVFDQVLTPEQLEGEKGDCMETSSSVSGLLNKIPETTIYFNSKTESIVLSQTIRDITVVNITGKVAFKSNSSDDVPTSGWSKGIYIFHGVEANGKQVNRKVLIY